MDFLITTHQKWSLVYMILNLTNVNVKHFIVFMTLLKILQKLVVGKTQKKTKENLGLMPQISECREPSRSLVFDKCLYKITEPDNFLLFDQLFCITQKCQLQTRLRMVYL